MTKKMIMLPLLAASVSLFFTGCEGKLVEKVDLIPNGTKRPRLLQNWYKKQPEFH